MHGRGHGLGFYVAGSVSPAALAPRAREVGPDLAPHAPEFRDERVGPVCGHDDGDLTLAGQ